VRVSTFQKWAGWDNGGGFRARRLKLKAAPEAVLVSFVYKQSSTNNEE
jgi:hypothetical protein